jgi:hypothetical protein
MSKYNPGLPECVRIHWNVSGLGRMGMGMGKTWDVTVMKECGWEADHTNAHLQF